MREGYIDSEAEVGKVTTPTKKLMEKLFEINGGIVFTDFNSLMKEMIDTKGL